MNIKLVVDPSVIRLMVDLQMEHDLPVNIFIGPKVKDLRLLSLVFEKEDEPFAMLLLEKCLNDYIRMVLK